MTDFSIRLADVGKRYVKYDDVPMLVTAALRFRQRKRRGALWALRNIDLDVAPGECLGVIGRNGSGKSTLLQVLAGVTSPTEGSARVVGRVAPLISVGVGFHPELTGRENVYVNGTMLGLSRQQIEAAFDEIVDFAEIGDFIDTPVKFYSSGMYVRLGFSVAIQARPDVLLVDEVLAVGDIAFQWKCFDRIMEIRQSGMTIVVVSHNLNAVRKLCDRVVVLHRGIVRHDGDTTEAISLLHELLEEGREIDELDAEDGGDAVSVESFQLYGPGDQPTFHVTSGEEATFRLRLHFRQDVDDPIIGFGLQNDRGVHVYSESSMRHPIGSFRAGERATYEVRARLPLATGSYQALVGVRAKDLKTLLAGARPLSFYVAAHRMFQGVDLGGEFRLIRADDDMTPPQDAATLEPITMSPLDRPQFEP